MAKVEASMSALQETTCVRAAHPFGTGKEKVWLRSVLVLMMVVALLLSLAACANQSAVSPTREPLSVTNNPGAVGR